MANNFPSSLNSYTGAETLFSAGHAAAHNSYEAKIGTGASTPVANTVFRGTGTGASAWAQVNVTSDITGTLPVANGGTGVTASTGTVAVVLSTSPTLVTPILGAATATSINKVVLTAPATTATLTIANNAQVTFGGAFSTVITSTAGTTVTLPTAGTLATLTGTEVLTNKTLTAPIIQQDWNMWVTATDTWVYASATTFTISGVDRTAIFTKGTRLKFTNNSITVYATVILSAFSTNTTVTVATNTDFTIANSAITNPQYSYAANPAGWPTWFTFTHNATWNGTPPTTPTTVAQFSTMGQMCYYRFYQTNTGAGASNNTITINQPIPSSISASIYHDGGVGYYSSADNTSLANQAPAMFYCMLFSNTLIYGSATNIAAKAAWLQGFYSF